MNPRVWHLHSVWLSLFFLSSTVFGQGTLTNINVTPSNSKAGAFTVYTISFQTSASGNGTDSGIPADGKIEFTFSPGFSVSGVEIASNEAGLDGGYSAITISGQVVTLTRDGTGSPLPAGGSATVKIASVGNNTVTGSNYTITVKTQTKSGTPIDGPTISQNFTINASDLDHFVFTPLSTQTAGQNFSVTVTARDFYENNVNHTGTVTLSDNTTTLTASNLIFNNQTSQTINDANITKAQSGIIISASGSGKTGSSNIFTVNPGNLHHLRVAEGSSGDGVNLPATTMTTDQTLSLHAAGYDAFENYKGDVPVDWQVSGGIGVVSPATSSATTLFSANTVGSGSITAVHPTAQDGITGTITVNLGAPHHIKVMSDAAGNTSEVVTAGLSTNNQLIIHASSFDADDNYIGDVAVSWNVSGGIGTISPSQGSTATFRATTPGTGQITADHATLIDDATGTITVNAGSLAYIKIIEGPAGDGLELGAKSLTADDVLTVHAAGYDAAGNYLGDQTVTWSSTGNLAPAVTGSSPTAVFSPTAAPTNGTIIASHATATGDTTGAISVSVGSAHHVKVMNGVNGNSSEVGTTGLTTGQQLIVHASSFDADDNYIGDVSVNWTLSGGIGTLTSAQGISTALNASTPGSGQITADHATLLDDATGTITVNAGTLSYVKIVEGPAGDGLELGAKSLTADDVLTVHAAGYDAAGNYLGDQTVTWTGTGNLTPPVSGSGTSVVFSPTLAPASGTIQATHASATGDQTGTITVNLGAEHHVKVMTGPSGQTAELGMFNLTTGGLLTVHASSFDADDNYVQDVSVSWDVSGGIGTLSPLQGVSTTLTATTPGTGQITANHANLIDDASGTISVGAGNLAYIKIVEGPGGDGPELGTRTLNADGLLVVHAAGYDAAGNYLGDQIVTWASTGNLFPGVSGSDSSVSFVPSLAPASGTITAVHPSATGDETGTITVTVGAPHHVKVMNNPAGNTAEVLTAGLTTGDQITVHASSFDADDNYIDDVSVTWNLSGGIGTLFPASGTSTTFTATTAGTGQITADHATLLDDATGTITVNLGQLAYVKIVEGPAGDGLELADKTINADDVLTLHAAGYDLNGNYLGDQTVTWGNTGNLAPTVSGNGPAMSFSPTLAPATGTITATHSTATGDETGTITIQVGAAHHVKVLSGNNGNTSEVGTTGLTTGDQFTVHAASFDADDNYIQDVSVAWSLSGGIGSLSPSQGISTTLTATTPGTGQITADHTSLIDDATGTITVNSGTLALIKIVEGPGGDGPELGAKTLTSDDVLTVHAAGYDAVGIYLGDQTVDWTNTGNLTPPINTSGTAITFNPTGAPASGTIVASHASATGDATGTITINVGTPNHVKVLSGPNGNTSEVGTTGLTTGDQLIVHAASFDADDNYIQDVSVAWSLSGGIGSLSPSQGISTTLTATTPGTGQITADHTSLIDDATGTITVNSGTLALIKIVEGPGGDGPELADKSITADDVVIVHAAGYDASGNYLGDQTVTWKTTGTLAPVINQSSLSLTFSPTLAPASGTITATHATATGDQTGTISVATGTAQHVKVLSAGAGNTPEVGTAGLTTGNQLTVHASSFDADGNYIEDVTVAWSVSGGIGFLNPLQGISTTLTATTPGTGQITADHASLIDDATGTITVNAGNLAYIKIVEGPAGDGAELANKTLSADNVLTVHAAGYDSSGNYLGDQSVTWGNTGTLAPAISGSEPSFAFNPTTAPASGQIIASHTTASDDSTGIITITVGSAHHVKVMSGPNGSTTEVDASGLTVGEQFTVHASSFDADENYIGDVSVVWSVSGGIGTLSALQGMSTTFTATTPGTGQITADHATLIDDATGTITVNSGNLAYIKIIEGSSGDGPELADKSITADDVLIVHAAGYDAAGNYLGDQTVTWSSTGTLAPAVSGSTPSVTFNPTLAPATGTIIASHASVGGDTTGSISVSVGVERYVKILSGTSGLTTEVANVSLTTGDTLALHTSSFDADNNYVADVPVSWLISEAIGNLNPTSGISTVFTATTAGSAVITADHATLIDDATGTITITAGSLSYVKVVEGPAGDGPELGNRSLTTDDFLVAHAAGYDMNNNYVGDQSVNWSVSGNIGTVNPTAGTSTTLTLTQPGTGRILADHISARDDSSGLLTVQTGNLYRVKVLIGNSGNTPPLSSTNLTTDQNLIVHAGGFDLDDNYIGDIAVSWSVSGGIGTVAPDTGVTTTFNPNQVGNGQITANHATALDGQSGIISVSVGGLAYIKIVEGPSGDGSELGDRSMTADQTLTLHAAGFDADSNYIADQDVAWSSTGTLAPAVTGSGTQKTFAPTTAPATGTIIATHSSAGNDATGTITVSVGNLHHVDVLTGGAGETTRVGTTSMNPGDTLLVHAGGFDADNNYISDVVVNWSVVGPIGTILPTSGTSATFMAQTVGTGTIRADASGTISDGTSGTITVSTGSVAKIILRTAPGNGGTPFQNFVLTTDEEVTLYAAGYDAGDNYFGDVNVTWSSTGSLSPAASGINASFTFSPVAGAADSSVNGTIVGTFAPGISDASGTITVLPGVPVGDITLTANPSSLPADGASTALISSSVIKDAENNEIGPNRLFTVTLTPANFGTITTPDADPNTRGHQIKTTSASQLNFTFRAGTTGGVAVINVSSGLAASGQTQITLGSLAILSISTGPTLVSRGQAGISVSMSVQNLGTNPITNLQGNLTFTGVGDRTGEYTVTPGQSNPNTLAGNATVNLSYTVTVSSGASLETITLDGTVSGEVNGSAVSATGAEITDSWTVQKPAELAIQRVTTAADTVSQGQTNLTVTVRVSNLLGQSQGAKALIDSITLSFKQGPLDKSADYIVSPNPNNPSEIPGNSSADLTFTVNVGLSATLGTILIDAQIFGKDANSLQNISDSGADVTDSWVVVEGNAFTIVAITPSQPQITSGMLKEWQTRMELRNNGSSNISLDLAGTATFIQLKLGSGDVTSEYTIIQPTALDEGGTVLAARTTGHLTFRMTKTGNSTGIVTLTGVASGQDLSTGLPISDNTNDSGTGEVEVQAPGSLNINFLQTSQPKVTAGRPFHWTVTATVRNTGGSAIQLQPDPAIFNIGNNQGYTYLIPKHFVDGDSIIRSNETKQFEITVDQTGTSLGDQSISLTLNGVEMNSDRAVQSNTGGTTVLVQSPAALQILALHPSQLKVTAGQGNPWSVTMVVSNSGQSQVEMKTDTATALRFRIGSQVQQDYQVGLQPKKWLGSATTILSGNTVDSVRFVVSSTGVTPGFIRMLTQIGTIESNSNTDINALFNSQPLVQVQTPPNVTYIDSSMVPDVVNNNGFYFFKIRVRNTGEATVQLEPTITLFSFTDGTNTFSAALDANKVTAIPQGDTTLTFQQQQVPADMQHGTYTPTLQLRGTQNGNGFSRTLTMTQNELQVSAPASVQIVALRPSQPTVTSQMEKDWHITMVVANNGGTVIELDSVEVVLFNGGVVTPEFTILRPAVFLGSQNKILPAGHVDSLRFEVQKTGIRSGATTIQGRLWVRDQASQERIFVQTDSGGGSFVVQQPAVLQIMSLVSSQPRVTQNQTRAWSVDMSVRNLGESAVAIGFNSATTRIQFSLDSGNEYQVTRPTALTSGDTVLTGNTTGILRFTVTKTGTQIGTNIITGSITGIEINSGEQRFDDTQDGGQDTVFVETPAILRVKSTTLKDAPNLPYLNTSQIFKVVAVLENLGQEYADSVRVQLVTNGQSIISPEQQTIANGIAGGKSDTLIFPVTASQGENPAEIFRVKILSALAHNTRLSVPMSPAIDDTAKVVVQLPAELKILQVVPSLNQIAAEQNIPWEIYVIVQNTGGATIDLSQPDRSDIQIKIDDVVQADYVIVPPQSLTQSGSLALIPGESDTLKYRVLSSGRLGGQATILAQISGLDRNTRQTLSDGNTGSILVETTAAVRIFSTEPLVHNFLTGTQIGLVNTARSFSVRAIVENTGFEPVENVLVQLTSDGRSQIPIDTVNIETIPARRNSHAVFQVIADSLPTPEKVNETFSAQIIRAIAAQSQEPAAIFLAADSTAQIRIQTPARLSVTARLDDDDNILSTNQIFEVSATVINLGQAEVDNRGRLSISLPDSFELLEPAANAFEQPFQADVPVIWRIRAPKNNVDQAAIIVSISQLPLDKNSAKMALTEKNSTTISLKVVEFDLSITKIFISEPEGATDDTLSTGQTFTVRARIAFSEDLAGRPRSIRLNFPADYTLLTPRIINNFGSEVSWKMIAPSQPHGPRWFITIANGTTGAGEPVESSDSLAVTLVSRSLLELQAFISEPEGARDNTLSIGQAFAIRANLNNLGTAGTLDTAKVRLELGQTEISVADTLEKPIPVNGFVEWQAHAPEFPAEGNVTVRLIQRALDENTGLDANVVSEISRFFVRTDTTGNLAVSPPVVTGPSGATDHILSSGQEFTVKADIQWNRLRQVSAELELPVGFFTEEARRSFADTETSATPSWIVRAPGQAAAGQSIRVSVEAKDANNDSLKYNLTSKPLQVEVVEKALLRLKAEITAPEAATDGIVSVNQFFDITATMINDGGAQITGDGQIHIYLPEGYSINEPEVKNTVNRKVSWRIKAKNAPSASIESIRLVLEKRPLDENTGLEADVAVGEVTISIQTEPMLLLVQQQAARPTGPTGTGERNVPMMSLILQNQGRENSSAILLRGLKLYAADIEKKEISPKAAIQRLRIVSHSHANKIFGELTDMPAANPVVIHFSKIDTLRAGLPDTIDVLVDMVQKPQTQSLQLSFTSSENIDAIDADSGEPVQVVDETGATGDQFVLFSETSVVTESNYNNFYNYPNPFQPGNPPDRGTRFWYYLPRNSKVEFKILTLLGELVYQKTFAATTPQGQAGNRIPGLNDIFWDGRNGEGKVVLNGVYIAVLKSSAGIVTTKVAVAK